MSILPLTLLLRTLASFESMPPIDMPDFCANSINAMSSRPAGILKFRGFAVAGDGQAHSIAKDSG